MTRKIALALGVLVAVGLLAVVLRAVSSGNNNKSTSSADVTRAASGAAQPQASPGARSSAAFGKTSAAPSIKTPTFSTSPTNAIPGVLPLDPAKDLQPQFVARFKVYDGYISAHVGPVPTWWGNRNIDKDLAAVDTRMVVSNVECAPLMCAVDVYDPQLPPRGDFDSRIINQPGFEGGGYTRRYSDDPTRLRIYVFKAALEARDGDSEFPPKKKAGAKS